MKEQASFKDFDFENIWTIDNNSFYKLPTLKGIAMVNNGNVVGSQSTSYNNLLTEPAIPTRQGYTFGGWYKDAAFVTKWNFYTDRVTNNTTLYALWALNPKVPTTVKAVSTSLSSINVSWTPVTGAKGYEVYRYNPNTRSYTLEKTTTATQYNNLALMPNTIYYYKIRAFVPSRLVTAYSNFSAVVSAKTIPNVPANFAAVKISSSSIKLTWSGAAGASGYEVYRATSSTGAYSLIKSTSSLYYTNTYLKRGVTYYYKVKCYRYVGSAKVYSGWTVVKSARP